MKILHLQKHSISYGYDQDTRTFKNCNRR